MWKSWKISRLKNHGGILLLMLIFVTVHQNLSSCWCLNEEGLALLRLRDRIESDPFGALRGWHESDGEIDPCLWSRVECSNGKVVVLNLRDLCLKGTLPPEIGNLVHIKSIVLRNNELSGIIPEEIGELKELEVLDIGCNNFSGPLPHKLGNNLSLAILLLDNNDLLTAISPEVHELKIISEAQVDESLLSADSERNEDCNQNQHLIHRRMLATHKPLDPLQRDKPVDNGPVATGQPSASPSPSPSPSPIPSPPTSSNRTNTSSTPNLALSKQSKGWSKTVVIGVSVGGSALFLLIIIAMYFYRRDKVTIVKPWATGLSGQLQKAFVTGVPKLKRSELDLACEDFSNVVGTSSIGTIYKGTLSSGVEIAVVSVADKCAGDWSNNLETKFRKKIDMLSKVNHKNFVNLIGYCQEQEPFTRMMVFEYAPNGTLFEHLHIKEAEHLDWGMRGRIAMGMAYCIEHLHQLNPPIPHQNLTSSAVALTEDYAAKICNFSFWNQIAAAEIESFGVDLVENSSAGSERDVYAFGVILFEMVTGRIPYSVDNGSIEDWAMDYVRVVRPLVEMVDPTLSSFDVNQVQKIGEIIRSCTLPDPKHRPSMKDVSSRLRSITGIQPDGAIPKISPLWWAELEILSTEGS